MSTLGRRLQLLEQRVLPVDDAVHVLSGEELETKIAEALEHLAASVGRLPDALPTLPVEERLHRALDFLDVPRDRDGTAESIAWRVNQVMLACGGTPLRSRA